MNKGCRYCLSNKESIDETLITFDESENYEGYVYIGQGDLVVSNDYGSTVKSINYCPMCGSQLSEVLLEEVTDNV